jgi:hypothetical protein
VDLPLRHVVVPPDRWERWYAGFDTRHHPVEARVEAGVWHLTGADGAYAEVRAPWGRPIDDPDALPQLLTPPDDWGVLLARKAGHAVARLHGGAPVATKVSRRHVQGRTKAGGQSQQRFARRRDNQAKASYAAAADRAALLLLDPVPVPLLVTGGDRAALAAVLDDRDLRGLPTPVSDVVLTFPKPSQDALLAAIREAQGVRVAIHDPERDQ